MREVIAIRGCAMKVPPTFFRGAYRSAVRLALQEIVSGMELQNRLRVLRGWKLFILIPRLLLFRPARGGKVPKNQLLDRLSKFTEGQWFDLLGKSPRSVRECSKVAIQKETDQGGRSGEDGRSG